MVRRILTGLLAGIVLAGCAGTALLHRAPPRTQSGKTYLARLAAEQQKLARAEQALPTQPRTPRALSRSIELLAGAIHQLASGLGAIVPPAEVAGLHRTLVVVAAGYERRLRVLARLAARPETEVAAANGLARATTRASAAFTGTVLRIRARLAG